MIRYRLGFQDHRQHYVSVIASIPTDGHRSLEVFLPTWTPGSYLIREYARHLESLEARNGQAAQLPIERLAKNRWRVTADGDSVVELRYRLYARELSVRTNYVDAELAVLNGAATFLAAIDRLEQPCLVEFDAALPWSDIATSLDVERETPRVYRARDYHQLVDSPIVLGSLDRQPFDVAGYHHELVSVGDLRRWETSRAMEDVRRIVAAQHRFWGEVPYRQYRFINLVLEASGGLEHDDCSLLLTSRGVMRDPVRYRDWLDLVSHEFFHTWNVRRLRPRGLQSYDYEHETLLPELWVAEGITSYYDRLLLARCGLFSEADFLESLSKTIKQLQEGPGRGTQSLLDAGRETWIKFYRPDENSGNSRVSYYIKGAVIAWFLDTEIRRATDNRRSLDDLCLGLWRESRAVGYTNDEVLALVERLAGPDVRRRLVDWLGGCEDLDYRPALQWWGLRWAPADSKETSQSASAVSAAAEPKPWLGAETSEVPGRVLIKRVVRGGPAFDGGLQADDELIAIDGLRVESGQLAELLRLVWDAQPVAVTVARRGRLIDRSVRLVAEPPQAWKLETDETAAAEVGQRRRAWLAEAGSDSADFQV
jgi:predicted metalloprotease with PDZ domain